MIRAKRLLNLQLKMEDLKQMIDLFLESDVPNKNGSFIIFQAYQICEDLLYLMLDAKGCIFDDAGFLSQGIYHEEVPKHMHPIPYIRKNKGILPETCVELITIMQNYRNRVAHAEILTKEAIDSFSNAYDAFVKWFFIEYGEVLNIFTDGEGVKIKSRLFSLNEALNREIENKSVVDAQQQLLNIMYIEIMKFKEEIQGELYQIKETLIDITQMIRELSNEITDYQSIIECQLKYAVTEDEIDRIIQGYSDACVEKLSTAVTKQCSENEYEKERKQLALSIGEGAWEKLDETTKTFLISSRIIFNNLISMENLVDYSGVCLLVTKALEIELSKRFCRKFIEYMKIHYPGTTSFSKFPTTLLDKYGKPIREKYFTLGSVAYVLCYYVASGTTEEQKKNDKNRLLEYCQAELFEQMSDDEIFDCLQRYADCIETIRSDYRNPSAHTNEIKRADAEKCFALVIDDEKFLKTMLDSFKK